MGVQTGGCWLLPALKLEKKAKTKSRNKDEGMSAVLGDKLLSEKIQLILPLMLSGHGGVGTGFSSVCVGGSGGISAGKVLGFPAVYMGK